MKPGQTFMVHLLLSISASVAFSATSSNAHEYESASQLTLTDLADYRAALSGLSTTDHAPATDPAIKVSFKDLWAQTDAIRGRRVTVEGRVERIFRQGPIGTFPALAEVWITSTAGDPFCLVAPQKAEAAKSSPTDRDRETNRPLRVIPGLGQHVRFTGTFLKMVQYLASDGARLAPLVVGSQPPVSVWDPHQKVSIEPYRIDKRSNDTGQRASSGAYRARLSAIYPLGLIVLVLVIGIFTWQRLRRSSPQGIFLDKSKQPATSVRTDCQLTFVDGTPKL
jgi:hypothetical protein